MKFQSKKIKIAVIGEQDLKGSIFNNLSEQKSITSIVENALKSDISTTSKFTLVERREISNILKQNDLNKSTDTEEINNAAKKLGVE
ncbi:MAG: hypothetical protein NTX57_05005, partial [Armatimonadetes bacterium]|nr:hypothetical protein [Armatimonadota bacterium]